MVKEGDIMCISTQSYGVKIIQSAILFEIGVTALISTEAGLLNKLLERNEAPQILMKGNQQISKMLKCLNIIEEEIVEEIQEGIEICRI